MLFNKCVKEPNYIDLYMELVDNLNLKFNIKTAKGEEGLNFRKHFLTLCQKKLENPENDLLFMASLEDSDDDVRMNKRQRLFGNVKLIAELFNRGLAPDSFVKTCIDKLMKKTMEDNIENAIYLIQGIGKKIYEYFANETKPPVATTKKHKLWVKELSKEIFDEYIDQLIAVKQTDKISSRVKFLIEDLVRAREQNWSLAFQVQPVRKDGVTYRKKVVSLNETRAEMSDLGTKLDEHEKRKKSINEQNMFGTNLEKYHKTKVEEKTRVRFE